MQKAVQILAEKSFRRDQDCRVVDVVLIKNFQNLNFNLEMAKVELSDNLTELLNLSGDCGVPLTSEAVETINYYRYSSISIFCKKVSVWLLLNKTMVISFYISVMISVISCVNVHSDNFLYLSQKGVWLLCWMYTTLSVGFNFRPKYFPLFILILNYYLLLCRWMICGIGFSLLTFLGLLGNITSLIILSNRFEKSI